MTNSSNAPQKQAPSPQTTWADLFEQFLSEKRYIGGVPTMTVRTYRDSWKAFLRYGRDVSVSGVKAFVISAGSAGVSAIDTGLRIVEIGHISAVGVEHKNSHSPGV